MNPLAFLAVMGGCISAALIIAFRRESARMDEYIAAILRPSALTTSAETGARVESPLGAGSTFGHPASAQEPAQLAPHPGVGPDN